MPKDTMKEIDELLKTLEMEFGFKTSELHFRQIADKTRTLLEMSTRLKKICEKHIQSFHSEVPLLQVVEQLKDSWIISVSTIHILKEILEIEKERHEKKQKKSYEIPRKKLHIMNAMICAVEKAILDNLISNEEAEIINTYAYYNSDRNTYIAMVKIHSSRSSYESESPAELVETITNVLPKALPSLISSARKIRSEQRKEVLSKRRKNKEKK